MPSNATLFELMPLFPSGSSSAWLCFFGLCIVAYAVKRFVTKPKRCCSRTLLLDGKDLRLQEFAQPGRGEAIRLALVVGRVRFHDERIARADWPRVKLTTPYGKLPVLYVDGEPLSQNPAILRYVGKQAGLYPLRAPFSQAKVDEWLFLFDDIMAFLRPTFAMERDAQLVARAALMAAGGKLATHWQHVETRLASHTYLVTKSLTLADIACFATAATLSSGWLVGVDKAFLAQFPSVAAHKAMIASIPEVRKYYEGLPASVKESWLADKIDLDAFLPPH